MPYTETATFAHGPFNVKGYFVAQSGDGGRTWKFFDGMGVTAENIRVVLPNYHGQPLLQVARPYAGGSEINRLPLNLLSDGPLKGSPKAASRRGTELLQFERAVSFG